MLWMLVTPPMLGLQLRVGAEWARRHLVRGAARARADHRRAHRRARARQRLAAAQRGALPHRVGAELRPQLRLPRLARRPGRGRVGHRRLRPHDRASTSREMTGDRWLALIHPEDRPELERRLRRRSARAPSGRWCSASSASTGEVRWLEARERIVREADCMRVVGAARDVTEARSGGGGAPPAGAPGAGGAAAREPRAGDGRRRPRLQQPADGDPRQRPAGAGRAAAGPPAAAAPRADARRGRARSGPHRADARLRGARAARAEAGRAVVARRRDARPGARLAAGTA